MRYERNDLAAAGCIAFLGVVAVLLLNVLGFAAIVFVAIKILQTMGVL